MDRLKNFLNGYNFETTENIRMKKTKLTEYLKDKYDNIHKEQESITSEELLKKFDTDLDDELKEYIDNVKMSDYFDNEKDKYKKKNDESLKEKAKREEEKREWQSKIDR